MSWSIGYDSYWNRDIGYGVPAFCDHPGCMEKIDRGLAFVCGGEAYGGEAGCGLYFCDKHHSGRNHTCQRCQAAELPFAKTADHPEWIAFKETDESWAEWRKHRDNLAPRSGTEVSR